MRRGADFGEAGERGKRSCCWLQHEVANWFWTGHGSSGRAAPATAPAVCVGASFLHTQICAFLAQINANCGCRTSCQESLKTAEKSRG